MNRPCRRRFVCCENDALVMNEGESIYATFPNILIAFSSSDAGVSGTLYVTTSRFTWIGRDAAHDFDAAYIVLHAVTHDEESYPRPCLYCQLDEEDEDAEQEVFFVPENEVVLDSLFQAFSHVAMLNPDMDMCDDEDDGGGNLIYNLDEVQLGAEEARRLAQFESVFIEPSEVARNGDIGGDEDVITSPDDATNPHKIRRRGDDA